MKEKGDTDWVVLHKEVEYQIIASGIVYDSYKNVHFIMYSQERIDFNDYGVLKLPETIVCCEKLLVHMSNSQIFNPIYLRLLF